MESLKLKQKGISSVKKKAVKEDKVSTPTSAKQQKKASPSSITTEAESYFTGPHTISLSDNAMNAMKDCTELDPAIAVKFSESFSAAIIATNNLPPANRPNLPVWMPGAAYPITAADVRMGIMNVCAHATAGGVIDSFIIAPNTTVEYGRVLNRFSALCVDPFLMSIAQTALSPLATVFMLKESSRSVTAENAGVDNILLPAGAISAFD